MTMRTSHVTGAVILLAMGGVVHGMWTHRWSDRSAHTGVDLLAGIAEPVGAWRPGDAIPVDGDDLPRGTLGSARQFALEPDGKRVVVSMTRGAPGVVAAHTPDVCFLGSGYVLKSPPSKQMLPARSGASIPFYVADFEKTTASGTESVRVRWTWTADGSWHAPDYPRLFFAQSQLRLPILYKLYVVHVLTDEDLTKNDPYRTFAADLADALGQGLAK